MKKLSPTLTIILIIAAIVPTTVEGRRRKKTKAKTSSKDEVEMVDVATSNNTTMAPTTASSSKSSKSTSSKSSKSTSSKSSKAAHFDTCSIANPAYQQAKLITGDSGLTVDQFLENDLAGDGGEGYLAQHSTAVYTVFSDWVERWVDDGRDDDTKDLIEIAGAASGTLHISLSLSASTQCAMMDALVGQMKDSCYYNSDSREVYVEVASAYMTGFNTAAGDDEKKDDFVEFCDLGSIWE